MPAPKQHHRLVATALQAAVIAAVSGGLQAAQAQTGPTPQPKAIKGKEKCYGVAKAGENGCQAVSGSHTCGGCSSADYRGEDWKWVPSGTCLSMGGQLQAFDGYGALGTATSTATPIPKKP
jgi:uncharacterized membrane protein